MKRIGFFVFMMLVLVIGGGLTAQITANNNNPTSAIPGLLVQTGDPNASVFEALPWKSEQFFFFVAFVLFNLVGMAATIALVMWFLHRGLVRSRAEAGETSIQTTAESQTEVEQA